MKKQHNEGFALAYVVIVLAILFTLAMALMSMTLRVLQAQQTSIERMQDKYKAQGEIERLVAELENTTPLDVDGNQLGDSGFESKAEAKEAALQAYYEWCLDEPIILKEVDENGKHKEKKNANGPSLKLVDVSKDGDSFTIAFDTTSDKSENSVYVTAGLLAVPVVETNSYHDENEQIGTDENNNPIYATYWKYKISGATLTYTSYEISNVEGGDS